MSNLLTKIFGLKLLYRSYILTARRDGSLHCGASRSRSGYNRSLEFRLSCIGTRKKSEFAMSFIKTILSLVLLAVIVVFGYWFYAAYALAPDTPYWAQINGKMPDPLKRYACEEMKKRVSGPVESCDSN